MGGRKGFSRRNSESPIVRSEAQCEPRQCKIAALRPGPSCLRRPSPAAYRGFNTTCRSTQRPKTRRFGPDRYQMTTILLEGFRADAAVSAAQQRYLDHWLGRVPKSCSVVAAFARSPSSTSTPGLYGKKSPLCLARQKSGGSCQNFLLPDQQVGHDAEAFSVWDDRGTNSYRVTRGNGTGLSRSTAFPSISDWAASTPVFPINSGFCCTVLARLTAFLPRPLHQPQRRKLLRPHF